MQLIEKLLGYVIAALSLFGEITQNPYAPQVAAWLAGVLTVMQQGGGTVPTFDIANFAVSVTVTPKTNAQGTATSPASRLTETTQAANEYRPPT